MTQTTTTTTPEAPEGGADVPAHRYTAALAEQIELAWQDRWETEGVFHTPNPAGDLAGEAPAEKFYVLDMFPYPSGKGLHVGHPLGYIATDVVGRFQRMQGKNVLHAMSYDAFGLPAEQYAVATGQHPRLTTEQNIETSRAQLRRLGLAHDSRRSFATTDPGYMRWTQWIFLQIFSSFYDAEAERPDGGRGRARPVAELVAELDAGERSLPDGRDWSALSAAQRADYVDSVRLAYISDSPVNWAPGLGTVLSNEEVTADGRSERGNFPVFQRSLRQWMMRITAYGDRLAEDLDLIDWPDKIKAMQRNWIGRSTGARVRFDVVGSGGGHDDDGQAIEVFTTRPDTLFGATYLVLSPEHPLLDAVTGDSWGEAPTSWRGGAPTPAEAVAAYRAQARAKTDAERQASREKTGVFTGGYAVNPVNGQALPVFTADYVLMGYGTGAIMAVPAEDERDWDFAAAFGLPVVRTVQPPEDFDGGAWTGDGPTINSANDEISLNGLGVVEAKEIVVDWLAARGSGDATTTYRLRDWLFSRQRYWGEPFPIVFDEDGRAVAVPEEMLPVELPEVPDYSPRTFAPDDVTSEPEPPLARLPEWVNVELDLGDGPRRYRRETNTMPNWAGSCWYELRYLDPHNDEQLVASEVEEYWMGPGSSVPTDVAGGADLYVGGVEHAVLHLLYSRFWHKVLYDLGHVSSREPFRKLFNQGYIQAYAYTDAREVYVPAEEVVRGPAGEDGEPTFMWNGEPVNREYGKMGKSLKNMVSPDDMYSAYGADTLRVYEMSMGPLDADRAWETRAVVGAQRFLQRLWRNVVDEHTGEVTVVDAPASLETRRLVARTIEEVRAEMSAMRPNTAIARLIVLNNHLTSLEAVPREAAEALVLMTAPVAPHIAEELWSRLGHAQSLAHHAFPVADPALLVEDAVTCVVQVAGKVRDRLEVAPDIDGDALRELALSSEAVRRVLDGRGVRTVIVRAPKLVNVVPA